MELRKYRILLNIFYFLIITYEFILYNDTTLVEGVCYHNNAVNIIFLDFDTYYINNCSFFKKNHSNICLSNRYIEKDSICYICDVKSNFIFVKKYSCDLENIICKMFFHIFIILTINLILFALKKNENISPKKNIKILSYNKSNLLNYNNICSICLTNFEDKYNFVIKTNCNPVNHIFCYSCSKKWFNNNNNCPYCRQIVIEFL
jgi:hypothetical protein